MTSVKLPLFQVLLLVAILFGCANKDSQNHSELDPVGQLLLSNEVQRIAHLENNAQLLASQISDTMMSIQNGEISFASKEDIHSRFENYFNLVKYTSWDDTRNPIIQISGDGLSASVDVQKILDTQYRNENGELEEHQFSLFAWNARYSFQNNQWKIISNTSTSKTLTTQEALNIPIRHSELYKEINEKDLIPEGVAYDNNTGTVYLSSTYKQKIVSIDSEGVVSDFKIEQEDGLWSTIGMEVDEKNSILWVVSFNGNKVLPMKHPEEQTEWSSKIYAYKVPDGELIQIYEPKIDGKVTFNDLCIDDMGNVYITESLGNRVFKLNPEYSSFEPLELDHSLFEFPNGISISNDKMYLYIATRHGIFQYNLIDNSLKLLIKDDAILTNRIDGLAYYHGTLIGNQSYMNRIIQYQLDEDAGKIKHQRILEANNPYFDQPATGEIAGDMFIYLANAQMRSGFINGKIKNIDSLNTIKILQLSLPVNIESKLLDSLTIR